MAFANTDGGTIAIGISYKTRRVEGLDFETSKLNELLRVQTKCRSLCKLSRRSFYASGR